MPVLFIVIGAVLVIFGGGCTLVTGGFILDNPANAMRDAGIMLSYWLPLGLAPLAAGIVLVRLGLRRDGEMRARAAEAKPVSGKDT